jgi:hypothetical protein
MVLVTYLLTYLLTYLVHPSSTYLFTAGVGGFCDFSLHHTQTHHSR